MESGFYLCDDLLVDILLRLPSKSLLRFKTVSKSWRSLITDLSILKNSPKLYIIDEFNPQALISSDLSSPGKLEKLELPAEFDLLIKTSGVAPVPVGSCNGLLLLKTFGYTPHLLMANVSTREFHSINFPGNRPPLWLEYTSYGFGYDSVNDDYKVVVFWSCSCQSNLLRCYVSYTSVYSLRNNAWTWLADKKECSVDGYIKGTFGVFVGGKLHWIEYSELNSDRYVIAFDFNSEEFERIAALPEAEDVSALYGSLRELGGCVAVTEACKDVYCSVSVWVLKESGWVRLLRTVIDDIFLGMIPLAYSKTGNEVLVHSRYCCVWYSIENGKKDIVIDRGRAMHVITCLDSLVRISDYISHGDRGI